MIKHLFKHIREEIYDGLFFTTCHCCGKRIIVNIPEKYKHHKVHGCFSCNNCIPENSSVRNDIDESSFTDVSDEIWNKN